MQSAGAAIILTPTADAWIYNNDPDSNYGVGTQMDVRFAGSSSTRRSYLKFDLSTLALSDVTDATLTLTQTNANSVTSGLVFQVYALTDGTTAVGGRLGADWSETQLTWNNAPANTNNTSSPGLSVGTSNGQAYLIGTLSQAGSGTGSIFSLNNVDLTSAIQGSDSGSLTLIIVGAGVQNAPIISFATRENASSSWAPSLSVSVVPEPSTISFAFLGIMAIGGRILLRGRSCNFHKSESP